MIVNPLKYKVSLTSGKIEIYWLYDCPTTEFANPICVSGNIPGLYNGVHPGEVQVPLSVFASES